MIDLQLLMSSLVLADPGTILLIGSLITAGAGLFKASETADIAEKREKVNLKAGRTERQAKTREAIRKARIQRALALSTGVSQGAGTESSAVQAAAQQPGAEAGLEIGRAGRSFDRFQTLQALNRQQATTDAFGAAGQTVGSTLTTFAGPLGRESIFGNLGLSTAPTDKTLK